MSIHYGRILFLSLAVHMLIHAALIECRPEPEPNPGFFGGLLGGVAGGIVGKMINGHKSPEYHDHYNQPPRSTTFETRETFANGCYKQVVKEPDTYNKGRFTETEQMVCPPNVQAPVSVPGMMPQSMLPYQPNGLVFNPPQVFVTLRRTGSYGNSGNSLMQTTLLALIALTLLVHFI